MEKKEDLEKVTNSLLHSLMTQIVAKLKIKGSKIVGYTPEYGMYSVIISREDGYDVTYILHRANCSLCLSGIVDEMIAGEKPIIHPLYWLSEDVVYKSHEAIEMGSEAFDDLLTGVIGLIITNYALVVNGSLSRYHPLHKFVMVIDNGVLLSTSKYDFVFADYETNDKGLVEVKDFVTASDGNFKEIRGVINKILGNDVLGDLFN